MENVPLPSAPDAPAWEIKESPLHGSGLFARRPVERGERIVEYSGDLIPVSELKPREDGEVFIIAFDDAFVIDGDVESNPARFANHSCAPNCYFEKIEESLFIVSDQAINSGEEITVDYGWGLEGLLNRRCNCKAPECIGYIVSAPYRPAALRLLNQIRRKKTIKP